MLLRNADVVRAYSAYITMTIVPVVREPRDLGIPRPRMAQVLRVRKSPKPDVRQFNKRPFPFYIQ